MPSGQTHDRITIWSMPWVAGITLVSTRSSNMTLLVAGGYMFGGLMFGPDLDIYSRQFQRWGFLRWIWLPYQKSLRHRSFLSHGPIIGTTLRVVYLTTFLAFVVIVAVMIFAKLGNVTWNWGEVWGTVGKTIYIYYGEFFALFIGCELGAMSHSLSDWTGSAYKRFQKQGIQGLLPRGKIKKRKVTRSRRSVKKR
ncbi:MULTISPECIES: metal-binding protein [unclassified Anabaena]|uniref:metal-binding protein n=1 Tax=unclassified Anabaena TaxID=2619674 RepID=UPI0014488B44|nr:MULTISPECIES: metal-binding protein [unclassified Anabaena]MTJ10055.1 metal-binding protein [Anabaena sp. UHCC 0204]MTJ55473.1 metal-binding protein [Anabaena sp. UHCC 0253]